MAAAPDLKQLGRYDLTRVLGKGAMGIVYEGMDPKLHRKVAIKTILKGHLDDEEAAKEYSMRFMREAQAVARLNHGNIVQVYDFGEEGDVAYIVMEFIKGKELKNFFDASERFELKEAVRIMCELCDALDFAHESGIVHRDIKPANVMLDAQAKVKLADFGVARVTDTDRTSVEKTQAGTMVGTPAYMSPEQITGGNIDRRTDIFSAGIILYQFLTGEKPFTGSGAWTIAKKIIQDHPPVPSSINNTISPLFDAVVNKALSKAVETRYQTAKEFGAGLKRALEGKAEEDDGDKTVVGSLAAISMPSPAAAVAKPDGSTASRGATSAGSQEVELEFWRAIKDGNDPDDFELYVQQFPNGIYAALAKRKIAKLKGVAPEESVSKEQEKKEAEEAAKREAEAKQKLSDEKAKLEAQLAAREAEYKKREAESEAKRAAEEQARKEADAKREAEMKARMEAEAKSRKEELEKAKKDAEALAAKREAEAQARYEAQRAKAEAEAKVQREAELKARKEADDAAARQRAEAEARAKKQAEELTKAKTDAEARAKKESEERAKREAEGAKREAELKKKLAEAPKAKLPVVPIVGAILVVAAIAGGAYWQFVYKPNALVQEEFKKALEATQELNKAKAAEVEAQKKLAEARAAELDAIKRGDTAKAKELEEARKRAEAEAAKQADVVKQRQEAAEQQKKRAEDMKKKAETTQPAPKQEVAKVETPKVETKAAPVETKAAPAETKAAPTETKAETKAAPAKAKTRSEREREEEDRIARELAEKRKANVQVAAVAPSATTPTPGAAPAHSATPTPAANTPAAAAAPSEDLFKQAEALEASDPKGAVKIYRSLARKGNGQAAKRLGDIYDRGIPGIPRDYQESLSWYQKARDLGLTIETAGKR